MEPLRETAAELMDRIDRRGAVVGVIGLGYVGLPLALAFAEAGFPVIGFDVDPTKVESLTRGDSYISHIGRERVRAVFAAERVTATADFTRLAECDAILICVPTPLGDHREPDLAYIRTTAETVAVTLRRGQIVILVSTTYPGTTRDELVPRLQLGELRSGEDFFVAFSPEREDPGSSQFHTRNTPKIVGGMDAVAGRIASRLYGCIIDQVIEVSSPEVAEASKLLENIFRAVNIALVNELKIVFERMGIDVWEVIEAAKTKPFGFMPFYPGPGLGGHCIPLDPFYLAWKAAEYGTWARFVELAGEINTAMPRYVVDRTVEAINRQGKSVLGAKVVVLGLSYKADIDDDRESPSFELIELLQERGAVVSYCDPHVPRARRGRKHALDLASVPCTAEEMGRYDAVLISTAHREFREPALYEQAKLVIDTRNIVPRDVRAIVMKA